MNPQSEVRRAIPVIQLVPAEDVDKERFRRAACDGKGTDFFRSFHLGELVQLGAVQQAYSEGLRVLRECLRADPDSYWRIHKGGPYYWLGMAAFWMGDFETSLYFMDAAASEDMRLDPPQPDAPGVLFIRLEGDSPRQAAQGMVQLGQTRIMALIEEYNRTTGRKVADFSMPLLREFFLQPAATRVHEGWKTLATALISFAIEADARVEQREVVGQTGTIEPFILHLFKGCVLFESLLKQSPVLQSSDPDLATRTVGRVLQRLGTRLGVPSNVGEGRYIFPQVVEHLKLTDNSICSAVEITVMTRNTTGHNLAWDVDLSHEDYQQFYRKIGIACLHAISCLYGPDQGGG